MSEDNDARFSRRKLLGSVATVGAASALGGAATSALLWDEEKFGNENNPNVLQGGELDLAVDWEVRYYNGIGEGPTEHAFQELNKTSAGPNSVNDQPGPIINLQDVKPGDIVEATLSAHIFGNPAFLSMHYQEHLDSDNGVTEPEDKVNGHDPEDPPSDGTGDGDLDDYMNYIVWYDDGDNVPQEPYTGDLDLSTDSDGNFEVITEDEYVDEIQGAQDPSSIFADDASLLNMGVLNELDGNHFTLDPVASTTGQVAGDFSGTQCYEPDVTEYIGVLAWLPRDIPGVNDNIIQTDKLEFQFGFDAIQCRHNVDENGTAINGTINEADAENNAISPGGNGTAPNSSE